MSTGLDGGGSFIPRFTIPSDSSSKRKREDEREQNVQQRQAHTQSKARLNEGVKQQETSHGSPRLAERRAAKAARAPDSRIGESSIKSMAGATAATKAETAQLSHPQLKMPTTNREVTGQEIARQMSRTFGDEAGEKANGEMVKTLVKFVAQASDRGKVPKGMSEEQWARQLADGLLSPNARGAEKSEKVLQHILNSAAKSLSEEVRNPEKLLNQELSKQKNELNSYKNVRFNGLLDKAIADLPEGERQTQQLMKSNPEFNRFQSPQSQAQYSRLMQQAMKEAGTASGALFKPVTVTVDEGSAETLAKFHDRVFDEQTRGNISPKQANQLHYILAGKNPALFAGTSKSGETMGELADRLMKESKGEVGSSKAAPEGVDQDLERVKSAFRNMKGAEQSIKGDLPGADDATMEKYERFALHPNKQTDLSREERRSFENAFHGQLTKNPTSDLSIKQMKIFEEGYKERLGEKLDSGEVSKGDAAAVSDPSIAFDEGASLTASQQALVDDLMENGGMAAVRGASQEYVNELNTSREAAQFLTELQTAARGSGMPPGQLQELMDKFAKGEITFGELMKQLGGVGSSALRKVEADSGFERENFSIDSETLRGAIDGITNNAELRKNFLAAAFMQEQLAVVKELFKELLQAGSQGIVSDEMVEEQAAASAEQGEVTTSTIHAYYAVPLGSYISIVGSLSTRISNLLADAVVSDIHAQSKVEDMKTIANLMKRTKDYNAMLEQRAQQEKSKGFFGKLFGGIFLVFKMTMCVMFAPLIFSPLGPAMVATSVGAWKDVTTEGFGEAMNKGWMEQMQTGLTTMCNAMGFEPPKWLQITFQVMGYAIQVAAIVALTVFSIIGTPITGGASLLAMAAAVAMVTGTVMMAVGSVMLLMTQALNDMVKAGLIDEDKVEGIIKILNIVGMSLSLVGMLLGLPYFVYELPTMVKSVAEMGGNVAKSAKKVLGMSDDIAKLSGFADDIARAADDAASLGRTQKEVNAAKQFSEAANVGDVNKMASSWGDLSDAQRLHFSDALELTPDEFASLSTHASQSKAKSIDDFHKSWDDIQNFESTLEDQARLNDLSKQWSQLDDAAKSNFREITDLTDQHVDFLNKLDENYQKMLLDDFTDALYKGDDVAMRNSIAEMDDATKAAAKNEHPDQVAKFDEIDQQLKPADDINYGAASALDGAGDAGTQGAKQVQKENIEDLEELRESMQKGAKKQAEMAHKDAMEEIWDLNEAKPRALSLDDPMAGLNAPDSESFFKSQEALARASDLETKRAMERFMKAQSLIEALFHTIKLGNTIAVEKQNIENAKHQKAADRFMAESEYIQGTIDMFSATISEIGSDQRELSQSISKLSKDMNKFYDGLSRVIQEMVQAMEKKSA